MRIFVLPERKRDGLIKIKRGIYKGILQNTRAQASYEKNIALRLVVETLLLRITLTESMYDDLFKSSGKWRARGSPPNARGAS